MKTRFILFRRAGTYYCEDSGDGDAGGIAAEDGAQGRIKHGSQPEQKNDHADPHDALEARQLRAQLARRVFLRRSQFRSCSRRFMLGHGHRRAD